MFDRPLHRPRGRTRRSSAAAAAFAVAAATCGVQAVTAAGPAAAAASCAVTYSVVGQWPGGFQGAVTVANTGDAVSTWTLAFTFPDGQTVAQGWGGDWTTGAAPSVRSASWNGSLPSGGTATLGFIGTWNGANGAATNFTLNGTGCSSGGVTPTTTSASTTTTTTSASTTTTRPTTTSTTTRPTTTTTTTRPTTTTTTTRPTTTTTTRPTTTTTTAGTPPASYPYPGYVTGSTGAHDPTVVKRPDGSYLVATTGRGIPLKTSSDRTAFTSAGSAFSSYPWTSSYTTGDLWAPDLSYRNGLYYLYYSASSFGSQNSAIFLATSPSGNAGTWTNRGIVISSSSSVNYNAIDPDLIVDQAGNWWLSFGSFWSGIKLISINPSTGLRSGSALYSLATRPSSVSGSVEAPDIYYRGGYYYLFASFDFCCRGATSTYRIMVGRSTSVTGPYVDRAGVAMTNGGGTQVLAAHGSIHGPGHSATLRDTDGDLLVYHYYADSGAPYLGINLLGWDAGGWPYVY